MSIATTINGAHVPNRTTARMAPRLSSVTDAASLRLAHDETPSRRKSRPAPATTPGQPGQTPTTLGQASRPNLNGDGRSPLHTVSQAPADNGRAPRAAPSVKRRRASENGDHADTAKQNGPLQPGRQANRPPSPLDLGPNLLAAYRLLDAAGIWFEQLATEFISVLAGIGKASDLSFGSNPLQVLEDAFSGGDDWVYSGWHWTVVGRYQRQRIGALSFVIDLGKPGRPAHALAQPSVMVAWSGAAYDWVPALTLAGGFWPPNSETTRLLDGRLVQWAGLMPGNGPSNSLPLRSGSWFYLLPLAALTNFTKLRDLVVQPALALLNDTPVEAAFANRPEVTKFTRRKGELVITA